MTRQELFTWIHQQYGTEPEYPRHDWNAVLRHNDNNKWYGVVLEVSADKLGLPEAGIVDVLNVKSDLLLIGSLRGQKGYFLAYHMNKEKWLSIQLGKPELDDAIKDLQQKREEPVQAPRRYIISKSCFYVPARADYIQVWPGAPPSAQPD